MSEKNMDLPRALEILETEISRSGLRAVAKRIGHAHNTVDGWRKDSAPKGERLRTFLEWAEEVAAQPKPALPDVLSDVERRTGENLVRLSKISGQAEAVLRLMRAVTSEQERVVDSLLPWVSHEEDAEAERIRDRIAAAHRSDAATPPAAVPSRRKKKGRG